MIDDERKRLLKKNWKAEEQAKLIASIPIPHNDLRNLFDCLDEAGECDHTLRATIQFLRDRNLDVDGTVAWLGEHGGFCDCEVLSNVEDTFADIIGTPNDPN
jgi:hypothetical protein